MRLSGKVWKDGKYWLIEVPMLDVTTQGRTKSDAYDMIADAIESLANQRGFKVDVHRGRGEHFEVGSKDVRTLVAFLLRRQREMRGLSLSDVAGRLKQASKNAYARYEQGRSAPTLDKLNELLAAVDGGRELVLAESRLE